MFSVIIAWPSMSMRLGLRRNHRASEERKSRPPLPQIEKKMKQINVIDFESCETWAPLAEAFVLLTADTPKEQVVFEN